MKKIYLLIFASMFMITGCTKNYDTVDEYYDAMKKVQQNKHSYKIEVGVNTNGTSKIYFRSFIKGDKWKTDTSANGGGSYMQTVQYDGLDLVSYSQGSPYAVIIPLDNIKKDENKKQAIAKSNPIYNLLNWKNKLDLKSESSKPEFINNKDEKNGFKCRSIKLDDNNEVCVSDKYGIAVYYKTSYISRRKAGKKIEITFNVVKVNNDLIQDSIFDLPEGTKKTSMDDVLKNMEKIFNDY